MLVPDNVKNDIDWLKIRREPLEEVIQKWNSTYEIRKESNVKTVTEFFKDWPVLNIKKFDVLVCYLS